MTKNKARSRITWEEGEGVLSPAEGDKWEILGLIKVSPTSSGHSLLIDPPNCLSSFCYHRVLEFFLIQN